MNPEEVQTVVLRVPHGSAVAHSILCVPDKRGREAARLLRGNPLIDASFGPGAASSTCCSIGFSFAGLEAMCVPESYLRLFRRQSPAFEAGAVQRSVYLGDTGLSAAPNWLPEFRQNQAHVVLSWHGDFDRVRATAREFTADWNETFRRALRTTLYGERISSPTKEHGVLVGERLGHPPDEEGEWVHFGFRDGISEICIDDALPRPTAPDCRLHAPGALLLGHIDDAGANPFALSQAPEKVRAFFRDSSFGILRPMTQKLADFEEQVTRWVEQMKRVYRKDVTREFVKAKLCGRWPNGRQPLPGDLTVQGSLVLDLSDDAAGEGCPFGSHVRRMRAAPDRHGHAFVRPLQRRSFPFGPAAWTKCQADGVSRGQLGHFFCASIEDQFEHLLGQWAARPPLGFAPDDRALDPLNGPHDNPDAALAVPLKGLPTQMLRGFSAWTTTLGTMYAWHPGRDGLRALLEEDFVPVEDERHWL